MARRLAIFRSHPIAHVKAACWLVLALMPFSAPTWGQDARRAPDFRGDGIGVYVNGQLACWLSFDAGRRRGSVSFALAKDGQSCSIGSLPPMVPRRRVAFRPAAHGSKCFFFDGRQFCE